MVGIITLIPQKMEGFNYKKNGDDQIIIFDHTPNIFATGKIIAQIKNKIEKITECQIWLSGNIYLNVLTALMVYNKSKNKKLNLKFYYKKNIQDISLNYDIQETELIERKNNKVVFIPNTSNHNIDVSKFGNKHILVEKCVDLFQYDYNKIIKDIYKLSQKKDLLCLCGTIILNVASATALFEKFQKINMLIFDVINKRYIVREISSKDLE